MATDAAAKARPKREAKAVEHFTIETKEVDPDDAFRYATDKSMFQRFVTDTTVLTKVDLPALG